jgi:hypothetical protein
MVIVQMSTSSALNLLSVMFASDVELPSLHNRLGPEIWLAFDFVPKKARDLRAPNNHTSLRLEALKYVYCGYRIVPNRFRPGWQPTWQHGIEGPVSEESGRENRSLITDDLPEDSW